MIMFPDRMLSQWMEASWHRSMIGAIAMEQMWMKWKKHRNWIDSKAFAPLDRDVIRTPPLS